MLTYSQVTFRDLRERFGLLTDTQAFLPEVEPLPLPDWLKQYFAINPLVPSITKSEKAISEVIIAPLLSAVKAHQKGRIGIFSGEPLSGIELAGICDFIITTNPTGFVAEPPIMVLVEAKRQDLLGGIPQCMAEMLVARYVNEQAGLKLPAIYGCVTTGTEWQFLRLMGDLAVADPNILYYPDLEKVLGTLNWIINEF
jgi:hypothetical protein